MQDEKLMFEEECYAIRGAVYEVYRICAHTPENKG